MGGECPLPFFSKNFFMSKAELEEQIETLKKQLTGNLMDDLDTRDQIHNLEMKLNGVKPEDSHFDCFGCGS
jgi:hypothetical protein